MENLRTKNLKFKNGRRKANFLKKKKLVRKIQQLKKKGI
tara:strand:- start:278 stop:394 length:117 start_codon:yes stop_codon:yes gene_type:complete